METEWYESASRTWEGEHFRVVDQSGQRLVEIPLEFARAGFCNTVAFAMSQVNFCFEESGHIQRADGRILSSGPLFAGTATFVHSDQSESPCTSRKGPRFRYRHRAPFQGSDGSTMSDSGRSSNHTHFGTAVIARDSTCLLSDEEWVGCAVCHILPQSRPEVCETSRAFCLRTLFTQHRSISLLDSDPVLRRSPWRRPWPFKQPPVRPVAPT